MTLEPISSTMSVQAQPAQRQAAPKTSAETPEPASFAAADQASYVDGSTLPVAKPEKGQNNEQGSSKEDEDKQMSPEQMRKAVDKLNKSMFHSEAVFGIHEKTNRITIKIIDKDTKELIKELPPEKTLDMIAKAWELAGLLIDERL